MGPTWSPPGSCRPQIGPMLATWTLQSGYVSKCHNILSLCDTTELIHNGNHIIPSHSSDFHLYLHFHSRHAYCVFKSTPPSHVDPHPSHTMTNILFVQISKVWGNTGLTKPHHTWGGGHEIIRQRLINWCTLKCICIFRTFKNVRFWALIPHKIPKKITVSYLTGNA